MKLWLILSVLLAVAGAIAAISLTPAGSGFPGDPGQPFNGLHIPRALLPPRPQPRPIPKGPALSLAVEAAQTIVAACTGHHIAVSVIDSAGTPKLYYVPDGTDGAHAYTAFRKAYTALTFKMPTAQVGPLTKTDAAVSAKVKHDANLLTFAGGLLLMDGDQIIGALGVSGAELSAKDDECGRAGISKIKDRLRAN